MKKTLLILAALVPLIALAASYVNTSQFVVNNSSTFVPCRLSSNTSSAFYAGKITLIGNKDLRTANVGTVYVGISPVNNNQPIAITSGQVVTLTPPNGEQVRLYDFFLDVTTADDGLVVLWTP